MDRLLDLEVSSFSHGTKSLRIIAQSIFQSGELRWG